MRLGSGTALTEPRIESSRRARRARPEFPPGRGRFIFTLSPSSHELTIASVTFPNFLLGNRPDGETIASHDHLASPLPHKQSLLAGLRGASSRAAVRGGKIFSF